MSEETTELGAYTSRKSELVVIYGRRRMVKRFAEDKPSVLMFEGLEGEHTDQQIRHLTEDLKKQTNDPVLDSASFGHWGHVLSYLTERVVKAYRGRQKQILVLDELPWMAAGRGRLISLLKYYLDNHWKDHSVMLVPCGSVASFMVKKVLRSKALYGRITVQILLKGLDPQEAAALFRGRRSAEAVLSYLLIFGGVPKYLEEIRLNRSFSQNINRLCFSENSPLTREMKRIFYNQFRESGTYVRIVELLKDRTLTLQEFSKRLQILSGGGLMLYLTNLEQVEIIRSFVPFGRGPRSKLRKYLLSDEYLHFHFKFIDPKCMTIAESRSQKLFELLTARAFDPWLGFAFERFCVKHATRLAEVMGFAEEVLVAAPYFERDDPGFQIDLLFARTSNVITLCEIKYHAAPVSTKVIPEMERKRTLVPLPRGYTLETALVSLYGPTDALRDSGYFDYYVMLSDIIS